MAVRTDTSAVAGRTGPLAAVRSAFARGVRTVPEIAASTGLNPDVVAAAVDHLVASGRLQAQPLASGCPADACGGCALLAAGCGGPVTTRAGRGRTLTLVG